MLLLMLLQLLLPHNSIAHTMPCSLTVLGCAAQLVNMARHSSNEFATFGQPSVNKNN
jgi:phytoene/squalene synthetase